MHPKPPPERGAKLRVGEVYAISCGRGNEALACDCAASTENADVVGFGGVLPELAEAVFTSAAKLGTEQVPGRCW